MYSICAGIALASSWTLMVAIKHWNVQFHTTARKAKILAVELANHTNLKLIWYKWPHIILCLWSQVFKYMLISEEFISKLGIRIKTCFKNGHSWKKGATTYILATFHQEYSAGKNFKPDLRKLANNIFGSDNIFQMIVQIYISLHV